MTCTQCGTEIPKGGYFCGSCGRPVGYGDVRPGVLVEDVGLDDVPAPVPSMERPEPKQDSPRRSLCSVCLGAYSVVELSSVDGQSFCHQCSPVRARRSAIGQPAESMNRGETALPRDPDFGRSPRQREMRGGLPSRRGWKLLLIGALLAALVAGGLLVAEALSRDRIDELLAGIDGERDDARLLVRKYEAGERLSYNVLQKITVMGEGGGVVGASEFEMSMDLGMSMDMETLAVDEEGNGEIRFSLHDFRVGTAFEVDGQSQSLPGGIDGLLPDEVSFRMRMDPFLQPMGEVVYEEGGEALASQSELGRMLSEAVEGVPRRRLKVGDEWETRKTMPLSGNPFAGLMGGGSLTLAMKHEVSGYKSFGGRDCMVIAFEGDLESAGLGGGGRAGISMDFEGTAKGVIFFDYATGRIVKEAMDAVVLISGEALGSSFEARIELRLDVDLKDR